MAGSTTNNKVLPMTSERNYPNDKFYDLTTTILSGQTDSAVIDLQGLELAGFFLPSGFIGTTITVQAAPAITGTFVNTQDGYGADLTLTVAASRYIPFANLGLIAGLRFIKLIAGSAQTGGDKIITLAIRSI